MAYVQALDGPTGIWDQLRTNVAAAKAGAVKAAAEKSAAAAAASAASSGASGSRSTSMPSTKTLAIAGGIIAVVGLGAYILIKRRR